MDDRTYLFHLKMDLAKNVLKAVSHIDDAKESSVELVDLQGFFEYSPKHFSHIHYGLSYYRFTIYEFAEIVLRFG